MKLIKTFLWFQLILGLLFGMIALVENDRASYDYFKATTLWSQHYSMTKAPDYHEPAVIGGQSIDQILRDFQVSSKAFTVVGVIWLLTCGVMVALAIVMLRLVGKVTPPNKSSEPTAVGACRSAVAVPVASRRWLSFFR